MLKPEYIDSKAASLMERLDLSTCNFTAIAAIRKDLDKAGYTQLHESEVWEIRPGGKYYLEKNSSAIFAFRIGHRSPAESGFRIIAAHSDSPCFKLKPNPEIVGDGGLISLNVEKYGGAIMYTWFDRPLSIAGRAMLRSNDPLHPHTRIFDLKKPVATIPHLAIHFNRSVNEGNPLSVQKDMKPVLGHFTAEEIEESRKSGGIIRQMTASHLGVDAADILGTELCLYPIAPATRLGAHNEYIQSARIDDLSMAFAALDALEESDTCLHDHTCVMAIFDNEETGSATRQGAASPVLRNALQRICTALDNAPDSLCRAIGRSFLISADDAHAWHPNYNEKYDPTNHPLIGEGPAIKINANCKYMTDAYGQAVFSALCEKAGVKCQTFVNHADVAGGSTLGNILTSQLDIQGVDMGAPIWAMHSAAETAGAYDHAAICRVFATFFGES